jgi:3-hydroxy-3-methylglutaryl CoA synthase
MTVGIDRLAVYVPQYALRLTDLARARDVPPEKLTAGCCAEFFTAIVPPGVEAVADAGVGEILRQRTFVSMGEYERLVRAGEAGGDPPPGFAGEFVFCGVRNERRKYGRSVALAA